MRVASDGASSLRSGGNVEGYDHTRGVGRPDQRRQTLAAAADAAAPARLAMTSLNYLAPLLCRGLFLSSEGVGGPINRSGPCRSKLTGYWTYFFFCENQLLDLLVYGSRMFVFPF